MSLVYKILAEREWDNTGDFYFGSDHDQRDGFLHFSTASQLAETLRRYYCDADNLILVAVEEASLAPALKWEYSQSRGEAFPHLFAPLARGTAKWARPIGRDAKGGFILPDLA